jgi:hypothetical protein
MMDEQGFSEAVSRLEKVNEVVGRLDPAIRSAAFAALSGYVSGSEGSSVSGGVLGLAGGGDIEELAFVVMMEATKSADDDLRQIMNEVKSITAAKQGLRELICKVANDIAANTGREQGTIGFGGDGLGSEEAYHQASLPLPSPRCDGGVALTATDLHPGVISEVAQLQSIRATLEAKLDSMSEMSEMTSLRLQMAMDRRSKFLETLSNIMKKISDTDSAITQNLK